MRKLSSFVCLFIIFLAIGCKAPLAENVYRKEGRFLPAIDVPVGLIVSEWSGKARTMGSTWLIDGGNGTLFSAKHVSDDFMGNVVELGANECKIFLAGKVYTCIVVQVPPLRDAVIFKLLGSFDSTKLPKPYKISETKVRMGDKVFVQGFHPHPSFITKSNEEDGVKDMLVPIFRDFYGYRIADPMQQREIVFDNLEAAVVNLNFHVAVNNEGDPLADIKVETNSYIQIKTLRNHKFSFGGLSGGVVIKINEKGESEAVGIVTAETPARYEHEKVADGIIVRQVVDTIAVTPIESVKELYDYARRMR